MTPCSAVREPLNRKRGASKQIGVMEPRKVLKPAKAHSAPKLQIDAPTDTQPVDLARGLQWLSIGENPRAIEIPAGASAEDIQCEEEIEKARLRAWLANMLDVL